MSQQRSERLTLANRTAGKLQRAEGLRAHAAEDGSLVVTTSSLPDAEVRAHVRQVAIEEGLPLEAVRFALVHGGMTTTHGPPLSTARVAARRDYFAELARGVPVPPVDLQRAERLVAPRHPLFDIVPVLDGNGRTYGGVHALLAAEAGQRYGLLEHFWGKDRTSAELAVVMGLELLERFAIAQPDPKQAPAVGTFVDVPAEAPRVSLDALHELGFSEVPQVDEGSPTGKRTFWRPPDGPSPEQLRGLGIARAKSQANRFKAV